MERNRRTAAWALVVWFGIAGAAAADLSIAPGDLRIEQRVDGGFHLFIRKKPDLQAVLITESTRDPSGRADNYAYRAPAWNPVNGDEVRLLDGQPIPKESKLWSLLDSTPEPDAEFGQAFHIWIPYIILYGYDWSRHGEVYVVDGTYLNLRAFALPYADYRGAFKDNPFEVRVVQTELAGPPEGNFMADTVEAFKAIAVAGDGELVWSTGADDVVPRIREVLESAAGKSVDLVLALDTTSSMKNDIDSVRSQLIPMLRGIIGSFASFRIGMVQYKDYLDDFVTKAEPFTADFDKFQRSLNAVRVAGGRDIPEAVHEALYAAATQFPWAAQERIVILIGDAPPHPRQRGDVSEAMVNAAVAERKLKVNAIILPQ
jgi:hypothetical protein